MEGMVEKSGGLLLSSFIFITFRVDKWNIPFSKFESDNNI
jgi:hypothetical protein